MPPAKAIQWMIDWRILKRTQVVGSIPISSAKGVSNLAPQKGGVARFKHPFGHESTDEC